MTELTDEVITLRPMAVSDARAHLEGEDEATVRFLSGGRSTIETVTSWIESNTESWRKAGPIRSFGIRDKRTDRLVGVVDANLAAPGLPLGAANITFGVYPPFRGKGYASRAVRLMVKYLQQETVIETAMIQVVSANEASIRVAERAGFEPAGRRATEDGEVLELFRISLSRIPSQPIRQEQ